MLRPECGPLSVESCTSWLHCTVYYSVHVCVMRQRLRVAWARVNGYKSRMQQYYCGLQGFGYAVGLVGFFLYNYIKMQQMDKPEPDRKQQYTSLPQTDPKHDSDADKAGS